MEALCVAARLLYDDDDDDDDDDDVSSPAMAPLVWRAVRLSAHSCRYVSNWAAASVQRRPLHSSSDVACVTHPRITPILQCARFPQRKAGALSEVTQCCVHSPERCAAMVALATGVVAIAWHDEILVFCDLGDALPPRKPQMCFSVYSSFDALLNHRTPMFSDAQVDPLRVAIRSSSWVAFAPRLFALELRLPFAGHSTPARRSLLLEHLESSRCRPCRRHSHQTSDPCLAWVHGTRRLSSGAVVAPLLPHRLGPAAHYPGIACPLGTVRSLSCCVPSAYGSNIACLASLALVSPRRTLTGCFWHGGVVQPVSLCLTFVNGRCTS